MVDLFHWKVRALLTSALILYSATSMLHVPQSHAPDLIDMVVPVSRSRMAFGSAISWPFFVQISSKSVNFVFSSKMLNFAISFVFRPKRISCVPIPELLRVSLRLPKVSFRNCQNSNFLQHQSIEENGIILLSTRYNWISNVSTHLKCQCDLCKFSQGRRLN